MLVNYMGLLELQNLELQNANLDGQFIIAGDLTMQISNLHLIVTSQTWRNTLHLSPTILASVFMMQLSPKPSLHAPIRSHG